MDSNLKAYLERYNIKYQIYAHPAVFTVEQSKSIKEKIPGKSTKCLFLKDENSNYYLIALPAFKRLDTKQLKKRLNVKDMRFASPEELKQQLNLTPGSVSIFGMIYAENIFLIVDKELWDAEIVGFHPNINTFTIFLNHANLEKFYNSLKAKKEVIKL